MAMAPIFHGDVTAEGKLILSADEAAKRHAYLLFLHGKSVECIIRPRRHQRSLDQNAFLHAVPFAILAAEWGEDIETTKLLVLGECFGWKDTRDGHRLPMKPHTALLTAEEASQLIDWLPPWAMTNFGVVIPLPREVDCVY